MKTHSESLLDNSLQAALSSIEIYNKPDFKYRDQIFAIININSWELLLKAKILKDNNDNLESIYIPLDNGAFKKNRSGNPLTIEIIGAMKQLSLHPTVVANLENLVNIRDTAIHFYNDDTLSYIVYTLGVASLRNYHKLMKDWFGRSLLEYNFYILPLAFAYSFKTLSILELENKPEAISNLVNSVATTQAEIGSSTNGFHFICEIATQIVLPKQLTNQPDLFTHIVSTEAKGIPTLIKTQRLIDKYPLSYTELWEKVKVAKPEIKQHHLNQFIKAHKEIIQKTKDATIKELEDAKTRQDEELKVYKQKKLEEIETKERIITELPELLPKILETMEVVQRRINLLEQTQLSSTYEQRIKILDGKREILESLISTIVTGGIEGEVVNSA